MKWLRCFVCFAWAVSAWAQNPSKVREILEQLSQTHQYSAVSMSPDGQWITWTEDGQGRSASRTFLSRLSQTDLQPALVTGFAGQPVVNVVWSPDSSRFAFLSEDRATQRQVFVQRPTERSANQITGLHGYLTGLRWSSSGKRLAFLFAENGGGGGPLQASASQVGEIGQEVHNQRISVVSASGGEVHQLSWKGLNVYEYDWSPDERSFVAIAAPGPADNNWWISGLYSVDSTSGNMNLLYVPPRTQQIAFPRWSPDGKRIAFIGGLMSDEDFVGGDLFTLNAGGGSLRDITDGRKSSVSWMRWLNNDQLLFTEVTDGAGLVCSIRPSDQHWQILWKGTSLFGRTGADPTFATSADGSTWVAVRSGWQHAPEIWAGDARTLHPVTRSNYGQRPHWGKAESISWDNKGVRSQGWLLYPEGFDPAKRYPMIVSVHGGPAGVRGNTWPSTHFDMSLMASLGYFVLFPNPRGSYGEGEAFTRANIKDFGGGDLQDILRGVDEAINRAPIDGNRIGVAGWSYGGYMTMWAVTQTRRFRAAVAGAGISDWLSYYGENLIDQWMIPYFGASVYDDPGMYGKSSPINYIRQVKTPTLVLVGERDAECPSPQSFEFWHALHALGVPTKLVVYGGEGHSFHEDKDQIDRMQRTAEWFNTFLAPR